MSRAVVRIAQHGVPIVVAFYLALCASPATAVPKDGDPAPDYVGVVADGAQVSLAAYAGKVVVLSFWASWCGPCRKELPILEGMQHAGKGRLQVIAVNIESAEVYRKITANAKNVELLFTSDSGGSAQKSYGVRGIPHMVIVGKDGRVLEVHRGYSDAGVDEAIDGINRALAQ